MKILITGTTRGIGEAIYDKLYPSHDIYTINRSSFGNKNFLCDLSSMDQINKLCTEISKTSWDVLINNAGGALPMDFESMQYTNLVECTTLNYFAPVLLMQAVLPKMAENGFGKIINITSIAAKSPRKYLPHYGASKAALESFSKSIALYYNNCGITVNCICPGGVETETSIKNRKTISKLCGKNDDYYNQIFVKKNGIGKLISPKSVAYFVEFLLSKDADEISGQSINICGTMEVH